MQVPPGNEYRFRVHLVVCLRPGWPGIVLRTQAIAMLPLHPLPAAPALPVPGSTAGTGLPLYPLPLPRDERCGRQAILLPAGNGPAGCTGRCAQGTDRRATIPAAGIFSAIPAVWRAHGSTVFT